MDTHDNIMFSHVTSSQRIIQAAITNDLYRFSIYLKNLMKGKQSWEYFFKDLPDSEKTAILLQESGYLNTMDALGHRPIDMALKYNKKEMGVHLILLGADCSHLHEVYDVMRNLKEKNTIVAWPENALEIIKRLITKNGK